MSQGEGRTSAREINDTIRYAMWCVFAADPMPPARAPLLAEVPRT
jgi:hypothetical protein